MPLEIKGLRISLCKFLHMGGRGLQRAISQKPRLVTSVVSLMVFYAARYPWGR